ncbi:MAG: hypothetical protein J0M10_14440 [Chitinophagales bacterium]|nr:hypothetical protein [Chitinophagales bacterium]
MSEKKLAVNLINDLINILKAVKAKVGKDSDCTWSYFKSAQDVHAEIDKYISELEKGNTGSLSEIRIHFAPASGYQELSMQNNWSEEYLALAGRFDILATQLSKFS